MTINFIKINTVNSTVTINVTCPPNEKLHTVKFINNKNFICCDSDNMIPITINWDDNIKSDILGNNIYEETFDFSIQPVNLEKDLLIFRLITLDMNENESYYCSFTYDEATYEANIWDKLKGILGNYCCTDIVEMFAPILIIKEAFEYAIKHNEFQDAIMLWNDLNFNSNGIISKCSCSNG